MTKKVYSFRLGERVLANLDALAKRFGKSRAVMIEISVNKLAYEKGLWVPQQSKPSTPARE